MAKPFNQTKRKDNRGYRYYLGRPVSDSVYGPRYRRPVIFDSYGDVRASCRWIPHHGGHGYAYRIGRMPDGMPCVIGSTETFTTIKPCLTPKGWGYGGTLTDSPYTLEGIEKWLRDWDRLAKE